MLRVPTVKYTLSLFSICNSTLSLPFQSPNSTFVMLGQFTFGLLFNLLCIKLKTIEPKVLVASSHNLCSTFSDYSWESNLTPGCSTTLLVLLCPFYYGFFCFLWLTLEMYHWVQPHCHPAYSTHWYLFCEKLLPGLTIQWCCGKGLLSEISQICNITAPYLTRFKNWGHSFFVPASAVKIFVYENNISKHRSC